MRLLTTGARSWEKYLKNESVVFIAYKTCNLYENIRIGFSFKSGCVLWKRGGVIRYGEKCIHGMNFFQVTNIPSEDGLFKNTPYKKSKK